MVVVDPKKTVKITVMPEGDTQNNKLADYMRSELKKRNPSENIKL